MNCSLGGVAREQSVPLISISIRIHVAAAPRPARSIRPLPNHTTTPHPRLCDVLFVIVFVDGQAAAVVDVVVIVAVAVAVVCVSV